MIRGHRLNLRRPIRGPGRGRPGDVVLEESMANASSCPAVNGAHRHAEARSNRDWWPNQLNLKILHQNPPQADPMGEDFNYAEEFKTLDLEAVKKDIDALMTTRRTGGRPTTATTARSSSGWPGTARAPTASATAAAAPASGTQRFAPLNSWPDNANLDKARRLLWPIKQKYGRKISWADLMVLAGNCALESMGLETFGFGGGREDVWEPEADIYWGSETEWLGDERYAGDRELENPLGRRPDGPDLREPGGPERQARTRSPRPATSGRPSRRMAMNDEETVALDRRRAHVRQVPRRRRRAEYFGPEPEGAALEEQGLGWKNSYGTGMGGDTITSGLEGAWTPTPDEVGQQLLRQPVRLRVGADEEPRRRVAVDAEGRGGPGDRARRPRSVEAARPDDVHHGHGAEDGPDLRADLAALPREPAGVRRRLREGLVQADAPRHGPHLALPRPAGSRRAAALAGPGSRRSTTSCSDAQDIAAPQGQDPRVGPVHLQLVSTAWASASTFRGTDKRGGANGARIRLAPQKDWEVNQPDRAGEGARRPSREIQKDFNDAQSGGKKVSLADLIVLGGCAAVEQAAKNGRARRAGPLRAGTHRRVAGADRRGVLRRARAEGRRVPQLPRRPSTTAPAEELLVDKAQLLTLTAPEMTVLVGGLRVLNANARQVPTTASSRTGPRR